ncbi:MAG: hypothetical protein ACEPOV_09110 [Hyphomicrobiales bacterium]
MHEWSVFCKFRGETDTRLMKYNFIIILLCLVFTRAYTQDFVDDYNGEEPQSIDQPMLSKVDYEVLDALVKEDYKLAHALIDSIEMYAPPTGYFFTSIKMHIAFLGGDYNWLIDHLNEIRFLANDKEIYPFCKSVKCYSKDNFFTSEIWRLTEDDIEEVGQQIRSSQLKPEDKDFIILLYWFYYDKYKGRNYSEWNNDASRSYLKEYPNSRYREFVKSRMIINVSKKIDSGGELLFGVQGAFGYTSSKDVEYGDCGIDIAYRTFFENNVLGFHYSLNGSTLKRDTLFASSNYYLQGDDIYTSIGSVKYGRLFPLNSALCVEPFIGLGFCFNQISYESSEESYTSHLSTGLSTELGCRINCMLITRREYKKGVEDASGYNLGFIFSYNHFSNGGNRHGLKFNNDIFQFGVSFGFISRTSKRIR